ncbi:MAG TPA: methyl-accepting chemotaxis protein [Verrucomicrobiae bacterium]|nr:methyl-accepting chemotaxis protein [Verrucomicrobiae bacterium]
MKSSRTSLQRSFRVIQGIVALLLIFLIIQGTVLWRVCRQGTHSIQGLESEGLPSLRHLAALQENLAIYRLRSYELMFVAEADRPAKSAEAEAVQQKNREILEQLNQLYPTGEGHEHLAALQASLEDYSQTMKSIRKQLDTDFAAAMKTLDQDSPAKIKRLNAAAEVVKEFCSKAANEHTRTTVASFDHIKNFVIGFGAVSIGFAGLTALLVTLSSSRLRRALTALVETLNNGSVRLIGSAGTVSSASQSLAEGASKQAASIEETSASLEELASMTKHNSENSQKANELAKQAREAADRGAVDMQAMSSAMEAIKNSSDDIAKIIKTIDEIAFQTNILALNAAVEAARAGEAGMGFAVVADEVRNLAQRSAQAAKETAVKIESAISKTAQGVEISDKVAKVLNDILVKARHVDELAAEVASASREQSQGITQINSAVGQMDKITQSNAANAEESAAAAEELNSQAASLKSAVSELIQLVGSGGEEKKSDAIESRNERREPMMSLPLKPTITLQGKAHLRSGSVNGNGNHRSEIPMEGDFKDF